MFCLAKHFEFLLFFPSLFDFSSIELQPRVDLLFVAVARLEDLKLDLSIQLFKKERFDVLGHHFSEILDGDFVIDVDSFFELDYHWVAFC